MGTGVRKVAVAGLGAVGMKVARALAEGMDGLELVAVSASDVARAQARVSGFPQVPQVLDMAALRRWPTLWWNACRRPCSARWLGRFWRRAARGWPRARRAGGS